MSWKLKLSAPTHTPRIWGGEGEDQPLVIREEYRTVMQRLHHPIQQLWSNWYKHKTSQIEWGEKKSANPVCYVCMWYMFTEWLNIGIVMGESRTCLAQFVFSLDE